MCCGPVGTGIAPFPFTKIVALLDLWSPLALNCDDTPLGVKVDTAGFPGWVGQSREEDGAGS